MAADILLYRTTEVPVGDDQRQHVELTRDLAIRFNRGYGEVFTVPRIAAPPVGARVMDLLDPASKMGKSHQDGAGPGAARHDPAAKPGGSNLLDIVAACEGRQPARVAAGLSSYGELKRRATEAVLSVLQPIQRRYVDLVADPSYVYEVSPRAHVDAARRPNPCLPLRRRRSACTDCGSPTPPGRVDPSPSARHAGPRRTRPPRGESDGSAG